VRAAVRPADLVGRPPSLWRYRELLPLPTGAEPVTLGEGMTPLLPCPRLGAELGLQRLLVKDESQLPTGSFKSRGLTAAVTMARPAGGASRRWGGWRASRGPGARRSPTPPRPAAARGGGGWGVRGGGSEGPAPPTPLPRVQGRGEEVRLPRLVSCQSDGCAPI